MQLQSGPVLYYLRVLVTYVDWHMLTLIYSLIINASCLVAIGDRPNWLARCYLCLVDFVKYCVATSSATSTLIIGVLFDVGDGLVVPLLA